MAVCTRAAAALTLALSVPLVLAACTSTSIPARTSAPSGPAPTRAPAVRTTRAAAPSPPACTLAQVDAHPLGSGQGAAGNWVLGFEVRTRSTACALPAAAVSVSGRTASDPVPGGARAFALTAGRPLRVALLDPTTCSDGAMNVTAIRDTARFVPVVLTLRGGTRTIGRSPALHCRGPLLERF
ncbi:hypothetical protein QDR37_05840 [Amnibacterium sp. CER49]|uniref:hypothetical protein n=1 Tax=Amnibacterium sp. CER49 TaxID=3039161 RepID=UPI002449A726|nr:hypothetical protein [Amnibacterium sp. CER49]MDH2443461.1 hypothetical protein [Amnibacterium sp. CER49]